ncbi:protein of unknown function [Clostridium beijerinckii]|nr:protein of unknown function [Clostridium beijerinckii]
MRRILEITIDLSKSPKSESPNFIFGYSNFLCELSYLAARTYSYERM